MTGFQILLFAIAALPMACHTCLQKFNYALHRHHQRAEPEVENSIFEKPQTNPPSIPRKEIFAEVFRNWLSVTTALILLVFLAEFQMQGNEEEFFGIVISILANV